MPHLDQDYVAVHGSLEQDIAGMEPTVLASPVDTEHGTAVTSNLNPPESEKTWDMEYCMESAVFEVQDSLFKVPRFYFSSNTDFFESSFAALDAKDDTGGSSPKNANVKLEGVSKAEFRALLQFMYPKWVPYLPWSAEPTTNFSHRRSLVRTLSDDDWVSVLELSTKWMMLDIRAMAVTYLTSSRMVSSDRVLLGRKYSVLQWLRSGYIAMAGSARLLAANAEKIGKESTVRLYRAREKAWKSQSQALPPPGLKFIANEVSEVFKGELQLGQQLSSIERVLLAQKLGVVEWLRAAYLELVEATDPFSVQQAAAVGYSSAIKLSGVRERYLLQHIAALERRHSKTRSGLARAPPSDQTTVRTLVEEEMKAELDACMSHTVANRLVFARKCGVQEWVLAALVELVEKGDIELKDAAEIGLDTVIAVYKDRETVTQTPRTIVIDYGDVINDEFKEEFDSMRVAGAIYHRPEISGSQAKSVEV
ncbi:hypothetical protein C0991_007946 [Blastosporella zonata]|nr:hypothetical protein C0991_007946 [Blastosporella zonata]